MLKWTKYILLLLTLVTVSSYATNVAVVDLDKILKNYPAVKKLDANLQKQFAPRGKKIAIAQKALQKKADELKRNSSIMTRFQLNDLQTEIATDKNNLQLQQSRFNQDLRASQQKAMQTVLDKINKAVMRVAKANKYQVVLQKDRTIYIMPSVDISNKVLIALRAKR